MPFSKSKDLLNTDIKKIQMILKSKGYLTKNDISGIWDITTERAIRQFQKDNNLNATGELDITTYNLIYQGVSRTTTGLETSDLALRTRTKALEIGTNNIYGYFEEEDFNKLKNKSSIVITYGKEKRKIIKDVIFRSVGQQIDASGEAIFDAYEFIARDIEEENL